jgi:hypothetical protein
MNRKLIPYGTKLPVASTNKELEDIRSCIMIAEEFGRHAVVDGKRFRLNLSLDEIEDLQGHVAADANHTRDAKLRNRLDKIFLKLQGFLDRYDDQHDLQQAALQRGFVRRRKHSHSTSSNRFPCTMAAMVTTRSSIR